MANHSTIELSLTKKERELVARNRGTGPTQFMLMRLNDVFTVCRALRTVMSTMVLTAANLHDVVINDKIQMERISRLYDQINERQKNVLNDPGIAEVLDRVGFTDRRKRR